jgi:tape measure domain-containing protein
MALDGTLNYGIEADGSGFEGALSKANGMVGSLGGGLRALAGPVAGLLGVAGGLAGIGKSLQLAGDLETLTVSFETMTGSAEKGKAVLEEIRDLGKQTPFQFPDLAEAGKILLSFGSDAEDIRDTLRQLGDVASGTGTSIVDMARIFGKNMATGVIQGQDLMQLAERGIPVFAQFAKQLGVGEDQVRKMASEGRITFPMLQKAFADLTSEGGMFQDMMAKQSATNNGLISTLKDNIDAVFTTIGQPINDALKPMLEGAIANIARLGEGLAAIIDIGRAAAEQGQLGELLLAGLELAAKEGVNLLAGGLRWAAQLPGPILMFGIRQVTRALTGDFNAIFAGMASGLGSIFRGIGDLIRSSLGGPFNAIVAHFQAGLEFAIGKLLAGMGKIPKVGKWLGLDGFEAESFKDILDRAMEGASPEALKASGEQAIADGLAAIGGALNTRAGQLAEDFEEFFGDLDKFEPGKVFDGDEVRKRIGQMAQSLDPDAYRRLLDAIRATPGPLKEAVEKAAADIAAPGGAVGGVDKDLFAKQREERGGKIKLYNAEESEQRRLARMSAVDRAKAAAGTGLLPRAAAQAAGGAPAMSPRDARRRAAETQEQKQLTALERIAEHTAPLANLRTA